MGTHPSGPSMVIDDKISLVEYIKARPACLGSIITDKFGQQLPFLFKVLSVQKSLSIQVHPDKVRYFLYSFISWPVSRVCRYPTGILISQRETDTPQAFWPMSEVFCWYSGLSAYTCMSYIESYFIGGPPVSNVAIRTPEGVLNWKVLPKPGNWTRDLLSKA